VYKRDLELRPGVLARDRRLGGWGAISHDIERQAGGKWTARSLSVVTGLRSVTRQARQADSPIANDPREA
jgi:hypothetical protein